MATSGSYTPPSQPACYTPRMTRADALARQAAGTLDPNCVVVITDGPTIGTTGNTAPTEIELNPVSATELGTRARVHTPFSVNAWAGVYEIGLGNGTLTYLRDDWGNEFTDVDANAPQLQTQFPWHLGGPTLRNNVIVESTLTGWDTLTRVVTGNRIANSTVDVTGWASGSWTQSDVRASTVTTGATFTMTNAEVQSSTVTGEATGSISLTLGTKVFNSSILQDSGSLKAWNVFSSELRTVQLRGQGGTVARTASISASRLRGRSAGDSITFLGETTLSLTSADVSFNNTWTIDGAAGSSNNIRECSLDQCFITRTAAAGRLDITNGHYGGTFFDLQGPGTVAVQSSRTSSGVVRTGAASTGGLSMTGSTIESGTVEVLGVRSLSLNSGVYVGGGATVTESGTTATTIATIGDRIDQSRIEAGAVVQLATTTGAAANQVTRTIVRGSSLVSPAGRLRIEGLTDGAWVDACRVFGGTVTITDAGASLSGPSAFHDNQVDAGATLTYTGGDSTARQIRNNHVAGLSTLTLTSLTGSAGGGLGDVFAMSVRGQSTLTVTGARVPGQPVRDCTVEQGSTLDIPASGCTQRCRVAGGATVNAGAFVHFDTEVSLAATKTLTAANINRLANKAYDDLLAV